MFDLLAGILAFFYELIPNYAVAIMLLTLVVLGALSPITIKGTRSMLAMQKLQPEMKRIQEMHKGDREAQNAAMMAFYQEHKINPISGCLPMLLQLPVLFIMFRILRGLAKGTEVKGLKDASECVGSVIKGKCMVGDPSYLGHQTQMYKDLVKSGGRMLAFGVDFGAAPNAGGRGAVVLYMLIVLVVMTSFWQIRQMTSRSTSQMNPQMQMMNRITPFFSGFISLSLPGGVTLYFLVSNVFRVAQQSLMYRFDPHLKSHMEEVKEVKSKTAGQPAPPKKGFMESLREQAETREANRRPSRNGGGAITNVQSGPKQSTGRVTQPGQRNNASRKRNKKKR